MRMETCLGTLSPVLNGVGGSVLVDYQHRVHARVHLLLIGLGEGLPIRSNSQSLWNRKESQNEQIHNYVD